MKSFLIAILATTALSACVVTPVGGYRVRPEVTAEVVVYPQYETDYYWDSRAQLYFFYTPRHEVRYMPRGWGYRTHGVPRGHYRGHHHDRD